MAMQQLQAKLFSVADLFAEVHTSYEIPIYQRNYAWGVEQIEQLIDDVWTAAQDGAGNYFLGNLIVARISSPDARNTVYEVIDGQQRLTTLHMLLIFLKVEPSAKLTYQSRRTATGALNGLTSSDDDEGSGIHTGFKAIEARMARLAANHDQTRFSTFLRDRVELVRASLPEQTDLNKYFEVMNTRGQQLQQVDIVKARLMSHLRDDAGWVDESRACFAWIWDACAEMDSYVQMALTPGDTGLRGQIFGGDWDRLVLAGFSALQMVRPAADSALAGFGRRGPMSLSAALCTYSQAADPPEMEDPERRRFESPIKFPSLLLHALKVMRGTLSDDLDDNNGQLDDNKLIKLFDAEFRQVPESQRSDHAKRFAETLLRCKFVLDTFLLKREFTATNGEDGAWALKRLVRGESVKARNGRTQVGARFPNAFAPGKDEWDDTPTDDTTREVLLLQSMLRVTYTSPRTMHWMTALLRLPLANVPRTEAARAIETTLRDYARRKVQQALFVAEKPPSGFNIERVAFTYLDYLLAERLDRSFTFLYRNSIEHFFPQYADREQENWERLSENDVELNMFGNLALVSVGANSKFSNNLPENKVRFQETIQQSLKLGVMAQRVKELAADGGVWDRAAIREHDIAMVALLRDDLRSAGLDV